MNIILETDSYKTSHWLQYPPDTTQVKSYGESRGGEFPATLFFGLQYLLLNHLVGPVVTQAKIDEASEFFDAHMGPGIFNHAGWQYILERHGGYLPIKIKAVPEGSLVPTGNLLFTIENTDPNCFWLVNYLETILSRVWYPTTVATQSFYMKQEILAALELSGDPSLIDFKLHDFGYRGVSSEETAAIGGAAHLLSFKGTDTIAGIRFLQKYYKAPMCGFSIPAAEHSTITSWGQDRSSETAAYRNMLISYPTGLVAVVSDSFNIYEACEDIWGRELKDLVESRDGTLVIRPDSGDPHIVLPKLLEILGSKFGYSINTKGYKVLNPKVRLIQGDGIDRHTIVTIMASILAAGWSMDNLAFGSGGGLLQKVNRDTNKFAIKCCAIRQGDELRPVYKSPVDSPDKKSKSGDLDLYEVGGQYCTGPSGAWAPSALRTVFLNGSLMNFYTFADIQTKMK